MDSAFREIVDQIAVKKSVLRKQIMAAFGNDEKAIAEYAHAPLTRNRGLLGTVAIGVPMLVTTISSIKNLFAAHAGMQNLDVKTAAVAGVGLIVTAALGFMAKVHQDVITDGDRKIDAEIRGNSKDNFPAPGK